MIHASDDVNEPLRGIGHPGWSASRAPTRNRRKSCGGASGYAGSDRWRLFFRSQFVKCRASLSSYAKTARYARWLRRTSFASRSVKRWPAIRSRERSERLAKDGGEGGIRSRGSLPHQQFRPDRKPAIHQIHSKPEYQVQNRYSKAKDPVTPAPNRSRDLDERLTSFERGDDVGEVGFYPTEQLCLPCVADPDPDDGGTALQ